MDQPLIREMIESDREAVIDLLWELNRFEHAITQNRATDRPAAEACLAANDERLAAMGGTHLVAEAAGRIIGYLCAVVDMAPIFIAATDRKHVWIADLIVTEAARGQGVGRALMAAAEDFARRQGLKQLLIGVIEGNDTADRLYENLGYRLYSRERLKTLD